jgi:hypothetical protein
MTVRTASPHMPLVAPPVRHGLVEVACGRWWCMKSERKSLEAGLDVTLYSHDLPVHDSSQPAWTLVTNGLASWGQREVAFTILRAGDAADAFPEGVIGYVSALKHFASNGKVVGVNDVSGYRAPGPFRLASFVGVVFFEAPAIPGVALPPDVLTGVFLTEGELQMASRCSVRRVLHRLGKATRQFPAPYWTNPLRPSVYSGEDVERSLLGKMPRATVAQASATLEGEAMSLFIPRSFAAALAERLAQGEPSAILPGSLAGANAALVWSAGQSEPEAIIAQGADPTAIAATFVALVPFGEADHDVQFFEDGYCALLSARSQPRVVEALRSGKPFEVRGKLNRVLRVNYA